MYRGKVLAGLIPAFIILALTMSLFSEDIYASQNIPSVRISVHYEAPDIEEKEDIPAFRLEGLEGAPLPPGAEGGTWTMSAPSASGIFYLGEIGYSHPGAYRYILSREEKKTKNLDPDLSVYEILVIAREGEEPLIVLGKEGLDEKPEEIKYADKARPATKKIPEDPEEVSLDKGRNMRAPLTGDPGVTGWILTLIAAALLLFVILVALRRREKGGKTNRN